MTSDTRHVEAWRPRPIARAATKAVRALKEIYGRGRHASMRLVTAKGRALQAAEVARPDVDRLLCALAADRGQPAFRRVLVDAMWENPNYWYRLSLIRAALGLAGAEEVAVTGGDWRRQVPRTLARLGIRKTIEFDALVARFADRQTAHRLLASTGSAADLLRWELPEGFPAAILYDGILKHQRAATIDFTDALLEDRVAAALGAVAAANAVLDEAKPEFLLMSHNIGFRYGALSWCASRRGIPLVVLFGNFGELRFCRIDSPEVFSDFVDRPTRQELDLLSPTRRAIFAARGRDYLARRLRGQTPDISAYYAFARPKTRPDRDAICRSFDWDPAKPIIGVYASNWFDYPHSQGMVNYTDFLDWMRCTLDVIVGEPGCNWLLRAHPCDAWYGGITLADLIEDAPAPHVRLSPTTWHGADVQAALDGLVTVHGTAGIEFAAAGKPVLLADRGWYHDLGFATWPESREAYLAKLRTREWLRPDPDAAERAAVFAGINFLPAEDNADMVFGDDSEQGKLYPRLKTVIETKPRAIEAEVKAVSAWWESGSRHFHTWRAIHRAPSAPPPV